MWVYEPVFFPLEQGLVSFSPGTFYTQKIVCAVLSVLSEYQELHKCIDDMQGGS